MSDKGYIKFGILAGIGVGVVSAIPVLNWANMCCCLPVAIGGGAAVSLSLRADRTQTMTTANAALAGLVAAITAIPVYFVLSVTIYLMFFLLAPGVYESLMTMGMGSLQDAEVLGFAAASGPAVILSNVGSTLIFGLFFLIFAPLGGVVSLHLFHKERINRA